MSLLAIISIIIAIIIFVIIFWIIITTNNAPITGNTCQNNIDCSTGTVCDVTTRTCLVPIGGVCNNVNTCVTGTSCVNSRCVVNNTITSTGSGSGAGSTGEAPAPKLVGEIKVMPPAPLPPTTVTASLPVEVETVPALVYTIDMTETESDLKTPYVRGDNKMLCKSSMRQGTVVDVANYSSYTFFLLDSGDIMRQDERRNKVRIHTDIHMTRLEVFAGHLHGVSTEGQFYRLNQDSLNNTLWKWKLCDWAVSDIIHTSVTTDMNHLWLQTLDKGYIYNRRCELNYDQTDSIIAAGLKRNYGQNLQQYLEYDFTNCLTTTHDKDRLHTYTDVALGVYDNYGKIVVISKDETTKYSNIRMINWLPYYIGG